MKVFFQKKELAFRYPFTISNGRTKTHQPSLLVALQLGNFFGYGEAPAINYYNITVELMMADLEAKKPYVEKFALTDPARYWHYLHHLFPNNPFLVCALDMACWDLFGKMKGQLLYEIWNTQWTNIPITDYTLGIDTIDAMVAKMQEKPWPIYKIKLGSDDDIAIVTALRKHTNSPFRVDVNGGWQYEEALQKIPMLKDLGVVMIEQPLPKDNWEEMQQLYLQSALPLFADESCVTEHDVAKCVNHFHGINIKLTKCSGITPALRMIENARNLGLQVMMGNMNESSIGSAAIANFLPQLDLVDIDGPLLLNGDFATGLDISASSIRLQGISGLGITPKL